MVYLLFELINLVYRETVQYKHLCLLLKGLFLRTEPKTVNTAYVGLQLYKSYIVNTIVSPHIIKCLDNK